MSDPAANVALSWGACTHTGRIRPGNEDAFLADSMAFFVADGMGGHQAGEVASALAVSTLRDRLIAGAVSVDVAVAAVVEANAAIFQGAHSVLDQRGMGTTLTGLVVLRDGAPDDRVAVLNVGDSRTYLLRSGRLRRVSVDHSYVQELVATGHITEAEARTHPRRNIVTRALGIEPSVRVDSWVIRLARGDRFVMCSDGLVDEVVDEQIAEVLAANPQAQAAAEALVDVANRQGGRDNITVVVVDVLDGPEPASDVDDLEMNLEWGGEGADAGEAASLAAPTADTATEVVPPEQVEVVPSIADSGDGASEHSMPAGSAPASTARRRGMTPRKFVVLLVLAAIASLTVAVLLVASGGGGDAPPTTSVSTTSANSATNSSSGG